MKTRVIKKNDKYYPQYLRVNIFGRKRWITYSFQDVDCNLIVYYTSYYYFNTKLEALHFIKKQKYGISQ
jgi:hypothetical protein